MACSQKLLALFSEYLSAIFGFLSPYHAFTAGISLSLLKNKQRTRYNLIKVKMFHPSK